MRGAGGAEYGFFVLLSRAGKGATLGVNGDIGHGDDDRIVEGRVVGHRGGLLEDFAVTIDVQQVENIRQLNFVVVGHSDRVTARAAIYRGVAEQRINGQVVIAAAEREARRHWLAVQRQRIHDEAVALGTEQQVEIFEVLQ